MRPPIPSAPGALGLTRRCSSQIYAIVTRRPFLKHAGSGNESTLGANFYSLLIKTTAEFSRNRSNTICFPSGVTSNVRIEARPVRLVRRRVFMVVRSSSQKSCQGVASVARMNTRPRPSGVNRSRSPSRCVRMSGNSTGVPSGRTALSGVNAKTLGPEYAMIEPSGDQTGLRPISWVRRTGGPPSIRILKSPGPSGHCHPSRSVSHRGTNL